MRRDPVKSRVFDLWGLMKKRSRVPKTINSPEPAAPARSSGGINRKRLLGLLLFALLAFAGGFFGGIAWERRTLGKRTIADGYANILIPGKGAQTGRRIPADFERKAALLMASQDLLTFHPRVFVDVVSAIWRHTQVVCVASKEEQIAAAKELLVEAGLPRKAVSFVNIEMNTMWIRDYGPVFLQDAKGKNLVLNAEYVDIDENGERWKDDDLPIALGKWFGLQVEDLPVEVEGGNLLSNGEGILVSTTRVLEQNEEQGYDVNKLFNLFNEKLGAKRWIYVEALEGEPTGHADIFISFLAPNIVIVGACDPEADPVNAERLDRAARSLRREETSRGPLRVYRIPMPPAKDGVWRSYANSILINGIVLVPTYSDADPAMEKEALDLYRRLLPTWQVVGVNSDSLVENLGALHCISQQVPGGVNLNAILNADKN